MTQYYLFDISINVIVNKRYLPNRDLVINYLHRYGYLYSKVEKEITSHYGVRLINYWCYLKGDFYVSK